MSTAATMEGVSPRETTLEKLRANTSRFVEMNAKLGGLFTQAQAALLLGLHKSRVGQIVVDGRLKLYDFTVERPDGTLEVVGRFISGADIERFLAVERKPSGRPSKLRMALAAADVK